MSSMESFYDGRQGASFIIVKRFDGITRIDLYFTDIIKKVV